ncbi:DUF4286 family protein [Lewinella sp. W8]|nr:DUF4286 family protein [Lewinella sp. W8]
MSCLILWGKEPTIVGKLSNVRNKPLRMILYEVTVTVTEPQLEEKWLHWMKTVHIPDLLKTGLISSFDVKRLLEVDTLTYCFTYHFPDLRSYEAYREQHAPRLQQDTLDNFPNQLRASRRLFELM